MRYYYYICCSSGLVEVHKQDPLLAFSSSKASLSTSVAPADTAPHSQSFYSSNQWKDFELYEDTMLPAGQKHVMEVAGLIFAYIKLLNGPEGITRERCYRNLVNLFKQQSGSTQNLLWQNIIKSPYEQSTIVSAETYMACRKENISAKLGSLIHNLKNVGTLDRFPCNISSIYLNT